MTIALKRCTACGTYQYPSRDICRACLSDAIAVVEDPGIGRLLASSVVHRSLEDSVALPLRIGTVLLDAGPHLICFVADDVAADGRVLLDPMTDASGRSLWTARAIIDSSGADSRPKSPRPAVHKGPRSGSADEKNPVGSRNLSSTSGFTPDAT